MRARRLLGTAAALALASSFGLAACGDDDDDDAADTTTTEAPADEETTTTAAPDDEGGDEGAAEITAVDFAFDPSELTVSAGAEVTFTNEDSAPHTFTADEDEFDSGQVDGGSEGSITAPSQPGEYAFHCDIHPNMTGTLTVE